MTRASLYGAAWVLLLAAIVVFGPDTPNPYAHAANAATVRGAEVQLVQGKGVEWWSRRAVQARKDANARARTIRRLKHVIAGDTKIQTAIDLAAIAYRVDAATLSRKGSCESTGGHGYNPNAVGHEKVGNETPVGLFQFLPSTWRTTPYARFSPFDPLAAALAAGWMHAHGRGGEWACR